MSPVSDAETWTGPLLGATARLGVAAPYCVVLPHWKEVVVVALRGLSVPFSVAEVWVTLEAASVRGRQLVAEASEDREPGGSARTRVASTARTASTVANGRSFTGSPSWCLRRW